MQCAEHFFAKGGSYDKASGDAALIAMFEKLVFDDELWPHVRVSFCAKFAFSLSASARAFALKRWITRVIVG